jgi:6-phosphogluconolactonase
VIRRPDLAALSEQAAACWIESAARALAARGRFTVVLSGGSTPARLYRLLAAPPRCAAVDWEHCHVFWGDERMVPADDLRSNYGLARRTLLTRVPIPPAQIHRIPTEAGDPARVAAIYEAEVRACCGLEPGAWPRFDLVLLGMGDDGHVASLFPGSAALAETRRLVVESPPGRLPPPVDRVTMTVPVFNAARAVTFLVAGAAKTPALRRALAGDPAVPAAHIRPAAGRLCWYVDAAAAGNERE